MNSLKIGIVLLCLFVFAPPAFAKEAEYMVADPEMEKTVNAISEELRCLVCQNQTIADSNAPLAVDLKNQVRDMVESGQSQSDIIDYMVERYGDFVRYRPPMNTSTMLLWVGPFLLLLIGVVVLVVNLRKRTTVIKNDGDLSVEENERLQRLLAAESSAPAAKHGNLSSQKAGEEKS
ncbi:MAG: cytochrome c-type biogenesis protein CcmH [Gammaproteobacteria bacterium]|nr:cytochrome c-type biogenesis protein CcmH [Gammaproteobacteria bacterium]MCF6258783.1 cytochrome c-type biogenesis protein CcmH [Gammaproteobacteria bacterium]